MKPDNRTPPVSFQPKSHNRKLSPVILDKTATPRPRPLALGPFVSSTYAAIGATCPETCTFKDNGCYASTTGYNHLNRLEQLAKEGGWSGRETNLAEANMIDAAFPRGVPQDGWKGRGRDLRFHISGDASCGVGALALGMSATRWARRGGGSVWTYTHRWQEIRASLWGPDMSALASVETVDGVLEAHAAGYACAMTIVAFPDTRMFPLPGTDFKIMPCPAETKGKTCNQCRLCMNSEWLRQRKIVIGFSIHGRDAAKTKRHLRVIQGGVFDSLPLKLAAQ